ncbi:zinc-binding dehydrogenase [Streptomyces sp. NPDC091272]|uniref:zinc-binding dehydrogenase n=1 Tax=Streptomyces sp. NPDC091272 TaxID=3365981 RepID=UPI0037F474E3
MATTRSADKKDLLARLGADTVIIAGPAGDLTDAVLTATGGEGADVVLDHAAGDTFAACLPATALDRQVVNIGRLAGPAATVDLDALPFRHLTVHGVSFGFSQDWETVPVPEGLRAEVLPAVARGDVAPVIDTTFTITQHQEAAARLGAANTVGKAVLTFA